MVDETTTDGNAFTADQFTGRDFTNGRQDAVRNEDIDQRYYGENGRGPLYDQARREADDAIGGLTRDDQVSIGTEAMAVTVAMMELANESVNEQFVVDRLTHLEKHDKLPKGTTDDYREHYSDTRAALLTDENGNPITRSEAFALLLSNDHPNKELQDMFSEQNAIINDEYNNWLEPMTDDLVHVYAGTRDILDVSDKSSIFMGKADNILERRNSEATASDVNTSQERLDDINLAIFNDIEARGSAADSMEDVTVASASTRDELSKIMAGFVATDTDASFKDFRNAFMGDLPGNTSVADRNSLILDLDRAEFHHDKWQEGVSEIANLVAGGMSEADATAQVEATNESYVMVVEAIEVVDNTYGLDADGRAFHINAIGNAGIIGRDAVLTYNTADGIPPEGTHLREAIAIIGNIPSSGSPAPVTTDPDVTTDPAADEHVTTDPDVTEPDVTEPVTAEPDNGETASEKAGREAILEALQPLLDSGDTFAAAMVAIAYMVMDGDIDASRDDVRDVANTPEADIRQEIDGLHGEVIENSLIAFGAEGVEAQLDQGDAGFLIDTLQGTSTVPDEIQGLRAANNAVYLDDIDGDGRVNLGDTNGDGTIDKDDVHIRLGDAPAVADLALLQAQVADAIANNLTEITYEAGSSNVARPSGPNTATPETEQAR